MAVLATIRLAQVRSLVPPSRHTLHTRHLPVLILPLLLAHPASGGIIQPVLVSQALLPAIAAITLAITEKRPPVVRVIAAAELLILRTRHLLIPTPRLRLAHPANIGILPQIVV